MFDFWSFLLQTLTASGVAALLLVIKAMFRDKLPPRWQFMIWGVLGISMLIPAGIGGRYVLFNWPLVVEVLKSTLVEEFTFTCVSFPFPVLTAIPKTVSGWLFSLYTLGVYAHLAVYALSYLRLRLILRRGQDADSDTMACIREITEAQGIPVPRVAAVPGLPSAFVCGVFRPVLAVPAGETPDAKIILHELLHLKSRDTVWTILICILRSIHWCNPLLVHCANLAGNDLEARCDQRVLELLEGEERRDYGRILLSMANDRFARTPGATCVCNGGKNIRRRIEAIARFRLYPAGMQLVSVCAALILTVPMVIGTEATEIYDLDLDPQIAFASARAVRCTTPAAAFDAYARAVLNQTGVYRAVCAPEEMQQQLFEDVSARFPEQYPNWDSGFPTWPNVQEGYYIYNLQKVGEGYEGLLVLQQNYPPDGLPEKEGMMYLAVQQIRVEKENNRWVAIALEEFRSVETEVESLSWGCAGLPSVRYSAETEDFRVDINIQTIYSSESDNFRLAPDPSTDFSWETMAETSWVTHLGSQEERDEISRIGLSIVTVTDRERTKTQDSAEFGEYTTGWFRDGDDWSSHSTEPGWGPTMQIGGGGYRGAADIDNILLPRCYDVELYVNNKFAARLELTPQEGGTS